MTFPAALWDGSDPLYAPCLVWTGRHAYWKAPKRYVDAGYALKRIPLTPGSRDDEHALERAQKCREHTQEMVRWYEGQMDRPAEGTWKWLIGRYRGDEFSPIQQVKPNTRRVYVQVLGWIERAIGQARIADTDYTEIMRWKQAMERKGRSQAYIKRWFTQLRMLVSYGVALGDEDCMRLKAILGEIRIKNPKPRKTAPTREQIEAICAAADAAGDRSWSTGILLQFWLSCRAVDIRGQYLAGQWVDGLVWGQHVDLDATRLQKTTSKTGAELDIDLTLLPEIRERLLETPLEARVGPVIVCPRTRKPYTPRHWAARWAKHRETAGVSSDVWAMDTRAAALTDGQRRGIEVGLLQAAATHKSAATTARYTRDHGVAQRKVIEMRRKG